MKSTIASRTNTKRFIKRQKGFTLVEIGLVLLIIIGAGAWVYSEYSASSSDTKTINEEKQVTKFLAKFPSAFSTQQDYTGVDTAAAINAGVYEGLVQGGVVKNSFGGTTINAPDTLTTTNDSVKVTTTQYDINACRGVNRKVQAGVRKLTVNGVEIKPTDGTFNTTLLGSTCVAGGTANTVIWWVGK